MKSKQWPVSMETEGSVLPGYARYSHPITTKPPIDKKNAEEFD